MKDNQWSYKPLSALCGINLGSTPSRSKSEYWGKGYSWVSISDLKEKYISKTKEEITDVALAESNCKIVKKGTLLMSFKLSIGKLAFAEKDLYTNEAIVALPIKDESELNKEYLYYALKSIPLVGGNQAAMGQTLNKQSLSVLQIPLPPTLDEQKRIAKLLSQCEGLIQKRKDSIDLLEELLRSTFLDMFGDPVRNEKGWKTEKLGQITKVGTGGTPSRKRESEYYGGEINWAKTTEVNGSYIYSTEETITKLAIEDSNCKIYPVGTILLAMYGQGKTRGNIGYLKIEAATNQACAAIPPSENINQVFLFVLLKQCYTYLRSLARGGNQENLNLNIVGNIDIILPEPNIQTKFEGIITQIESIKHRFRDSLKELKNLYGSIRQRAFKGELDLSKLDISDMEDSKKKDLEAVKEDLTEDRFEDLMDSFEHTLPTGEVPSNRETDIRDMSIRHYLRLPDDEATVGFEFSKMDKDYFYQFILTKGFPEGTFTLPDLEQYARKYILRGTGFEFTYDNWKTIIFRFIGAKQPLIEQVFDEDDKTIKLKLTDEAFKV